MARKVTRRHPFTGCKQLAVGRTPWATIRIFYTPKHQGRRLVFFMSAKVGTAPERNTIKRRFRALWSSLPTSLTHEWSMLVIPHRHQPLVPYATISSTLDQVAESARRRMSPDLLNGHQAAPGNV
jgi:ribonuclease P protein component